MPERSLAWTSQHSLTHLICEQSAKIKFGKAMYTLLLMRSELTAVWGKMSRGPLGRK